MCRPSTGKFPSPANIKSEVTQVPAAPIEGAPETTSTAVRLTKNNVAHYRQENVFLKVNQISDPEIALRDKSDAQVLSLMQSIHGYGFDHARELLSITNTAAKSRSEKREGALSATPRVHKEALSVVLLHERHRLRPLLVLQGR